MSNVSKTSSIQFRDYPHCIIIHVKFTRVGFPCPADFNPADHYVNVLAVVPGQEEERRARVAQICDAFKESPQGKLVEAEVKYEKDRAESSIGMIAQAGKKKISPYKVVLINEYG